MRIRSNESLNNMKRVIVFVFALLMMKMSFAQTQLELNKKAQDDFSKADNELNIVFKKISTEYKDDTLFIKNLKAAQKIWIQFRDAEMKMKFPDANEYGSVLPMCWSMYKEQLTRDRIKTLNEWLNGVPEGDVCSGSAKIRKD
jgi:uncharacterized protein YecT (DUF1311 family)